MEVLLRFRSRWQLRSPEPSTLTERTRHYTHNAAPVYWQSKASSVAFATPLIGEAHADISSGAVEIFAAGNATMELEVRHLEAADARAPQCLVA